MSARRHGRRRGTSSSGQQARTGRSISFASVPVDTSPSYSANWLGLERSQLAYWRLSDWVPQPTPASTTISVSNAASRAQVLSNSVLFSVQEMWFKRMVEEMNTPNPLYTLMGRATR
jgi:hypothetical protein